MAYERMTDEQLREYEEYLYDEERDGEDTWAERDQVLWEMNMRGMCSAPRLESLREKGETSQEAEEQLPLVWKADEPKAP